MDDKLRQLQLEELRLLELFDSLCRQNGLRYFMLGGTLLGAIRHDGFIPWDDDVDVCMPRSDYERLLSMAGKLLKPPYYMNSMEIDSSYRYCFARIATSEVKIINHSANIPRTEDAWIDIIPMDGMPEGGLKLKLHKLHLYFWRSMNQICQYDEIVDQKRRRGTLETMLVRIAGWRIWRMFTNYHSCMEHIKKTLKKYDYDCCDTVINYMAAYGFKETFSRSWFGEGKEYGFEGRRFIGPADYDSVLKQIYGDYMTLPPESDRNKHNAEIVQL